MFHDYEVQGACYCENRMFATVRGKQCAKATSKMQTERCYPYRSAGSFFPALTFRETHECALDDM